MEDIKEKKETKNKQKHMIVLNGKDNEDSVMAFSRRDEKLIEKEMSGEIVNEYFYQFKQGNRTITGLSIKGVNEIVRKMGNIHIMEPQITEKPDSLQVMVKVKDVQNDIETWGIAEQSKKSLFNGGIDPFALQKAFSKARRNALRQLIPESIISKSYEKWQKEQIQMKKDAKDLM